MAPPTLASAGHPGFAAARALIVQRHRVETKTVLMSLDGWLIQHVYVVVLLGAMVDAVGVPFPGRIMLITVGSLSVPDTSSGWSLALVILLATVGTVVGDHVWYFLGRHAGRRLFEFYCRVVRLSRAQVLQADRFLRRFGGLSLVIARLAATLRLALVPLAVSRGMSYARFLAFDTTGALIWTTAFVCLGRVAGTLGASSGLIGTLAILSTLAMASIALGVIARRRMSRSVSVS